MMFERFSTEARAAVERAVERAHATTSGEVRPEHLLHALLDTATVGRLVRAAGSSSEVLARELDRLRLQYVDGLDQDDADALASLGIDLDEVVRRVDGNLGALPRARRRLRMSRPAKHVLGLALREAVDLGDRHVGAEHLLLGAACGDDRVVRDTLAAAGLDHATLRRLVIGAKVGT